MAESKTYTWNIQDLESEELITFYDAISVKEDTADVASSDPGSKVQDSLLKEPVKRAESNISAMKERLDYEGKVDNLQNDYKYALDANGIRQSIHEDVERVINSGEDFEKLSLKDLFIKMANSKGGTFAPGVVDHLMEMDVSKSVTMYTKSDEVKQRIEEAVSREDIKESWKKEIVESMQ